MESFSTTVTALKSPFSPSAIPRKTHLFKSPATPTHFAIHHLRDKPNSIPKRHNTYPSLFSNNIFVASPSHSEYQISSLKFATRVVHRKATSGYAAALLDIARCNNTLDAVERDVRRFLRLFQNQELVSFLVDSSIEDKTKGEVLKELAGKGKFQKHLVVFLKMLIEKNKVGLVNEMLEEFERFYDQLSGTRIVLVSSAKKLEEDELLGIAKRVQKMSGAAKVKVRHLINQNFPSLAV